VAEISQAERDKLTIEHAIAVKIASEYIQRAKDELDARANYLNLAMHEFNTFLGLKPEEKTTFWDLAFVLLDMVPGLRLTKFLGGQLQAATLAVEIAKAAGNTNRVATVVKGGATVAREGLKAKEVVDKLKDPVEKIVKVGGVVKTLEESQKATTSDLRSKYDTQRKAIQALIEDGNLATAAWDKATDAEILEYANRLAGAKSPNSATTLDGYMSRLLTPVPTLTKEQLEEVETRYLWEMIGAWARDEARIVRTYGPGPGSTVSVTGINSAQEKEILQLFGYSARRTHIFYQGMVTSVLQFAYQQNVKQVTKTRERIVYRR
jgi:hypothetical protein